MRNVIVTGVPRAELALVDQLTALGVATVHEAIGRAGFLGRDAGRRDRGHRAVLAR
jgi:4-hydroxy-4-methyl-2-oxoglutarate aldolase